MAPGLVDAIKARIGPIALVDLTFPRCFMHAQGRSETRVGLIARPHDGEQRFLSTLRQRGGAAPIALVEPAEGSNQHDLVELSALDETPVFLVEDFETARRLAGNETEDARAFLFPDLPARAADGGQSWPVIPHFDLTCLSEADERACFWLATPKRADADPTLSAFETIAARPTERLFIPARHFIHDGGYQAEGDDSYSWLWTGPSRQFRMVVPRLENETTRRIEVSIIRAESAENLSDIIVQVDGRPVQHHFEAWSENSGKLVIDLPAPAPYTILGIGIPKLDIDKNSGRALGICIDKLVLLAEEDT